MAFRTLGVVGDFSHSLHIQQQAGLLLIVYIRSSWLPFSHPNGSAHYFFFVFFLSFPSDETFFSPSAFIFFFFFFSLSFPSVFFRFVFALLLEMTSSLLGCTCVTPNHQKSSGRGRYLH